MAMKHWRYHSLLIRDLSICESKLNAEGEKGWELVNVCLMDSNTARAFFKMPAEDLAATSPIELEMSVVTHSPFG
jgi:hypothetical protein